MALTLIIPVFNGTSYLANTFLELDLFCRENPKMLEAIIFVNDGSSDDSQEKLEFLNKKYDHLPIKILTIEQNKGKGFAIAYALKHGNIHSDFVGFTDVDLPFGLKELKLVKEKLQFYDIVVGNRLLHNETKTQYSFYRYLFSRIFRLFLPKEIRKYKDTQCGFKFFKKDVSLTLFSQTTTNNWVFDVELFLIAERNNYKIFEVPVSLRASWRQNKSGVSLWKHGLTILGDLFKISSSLKKKK